MMILKLRWLGVLVTMMTLAWPVAALAGPLQDVRDEVSGSSSSDDSSSGSSSGGSCCSWWGDDDDDDSSGSSSTASIQPRPRAHYLRYPYRNGALGVLSIRGEEALPEGEVDRKIAARVWGEGARQQDGLWRTGGGLRVDGQYLSFDGDLSYYLEPKGADALYLGTANLSLVAVRERRFLWRLGGGANTMIDGRVPGQDRREYALGWNITSSFDAFPVYPLVLSGRADLGRLHKAWMVRARATAGVMVWRVELYGGYEHTQVGRVGLGGPTVGLRLWL